jgi:hypothetical protein
MIADVFMFGLDCSPIKRQKNIAILPDFFLVSKFRFLFPFLRVTFSTVTTGFKKQEQAYALCLSEA